MVTMGNVESDQSITAGMYRTVVNIFSDKLISVFF